MTRIRVRLKKYQIKKPESGVVNFLFVLPNVRCKTLFCLTITSYKNKYWTEKKLFKQIQPRFTISRRPTKFTIFFFKRVTALNTSLLKLWKYLLGAQYFFPKLLNGLHYPILPQIQKWKHQNNMWNLFKVNNK